MFIIFITFVHVFLGTHLSSLQTLQNTLNYPEYLVGSKSVPRGMKTHIMYATAMNSIKFQTSLMSLSGSARNSQIKSRG
jgi:hypothetical protein